MLTVDVPVICVRLGVIPGEAPVEIDCVIVLLGVKVPVIVAVGDLVTRAVTVVLIVLEGDVLMVFVGVLEAVMETLGVFVLELDAVTVGVCVSVCVPVPD
jgi:hypothetical protein